MADKNLKELSDDAVVVQDACNLSGVVHSLSRTVSRLRELNPDADTETINQHPIVQAYVFKLAQLAFNKFIINELDFDKAYRRVLDLKEGK